MQTARVAIRGVIGFLTAGLAPSIQGYRRAGSELTILSVLGPGGHRA